MRFGIFFEIGVPRPFVDNIEQRVFHNALEQARLADELGFDSVWAVEHHFLEEYSHSSAPELLLTAIAAQTERIRVGHGAVVCVPEINHPIRVAERAAVLDILSGGRLEFGTARSSTWTEVGGFGVDPDTTKKTWDEYVRVLPKMWTEEYLAWDGVCFSMPERSILPKPIQDPHPPLWVTVTSPGTELDAAERGIGCLGVASAGYAEQERRTREYHRRIQNCDPVSDVVNDNVSTLNFLYCHPDPQVARVRGLQMQGRFGVENANLLFTREAFPSNAYQSLGNLAPKPAKREAGSASDAPAVPEGSCIGDPERIIDAIKHWESIGIDGINFMVNGCEVLEQKEVLDSMRLFSREVMPHFSDSGEAG
ncbi:MAG: LLM class flavin-dependent oxidoreductase [Myxococcales bacterium]|nr:LLM class flavin-dependent oxidoreductase [Myxococcales bacterium]